MAICIHCEKVLVEEEEIQCDICALDDYEWQEAEMREMHLIESLEEVE